MAYDEKFAQELVGQLKGNFEQLLELEGEGAAMDYMNGGLQVGMAIFFSNPYASTHYLQGAIDMIESLKKIRYRAEEKQ